MKEMGLIARVSGARCISYNSQTYYLNLSDVDECENETHNCDQNATCTDTDGSFNCTCNDGYVGDGVNCTSK